MNIDYLMKVNKVVNHPPLEVCKDQYTVQKKIDILQEVVKTRKVFTHYEKKYSLPFNTISTWKKQLSNGKLGDHPGLSIQLEELRLERLASRGTTNA